jgi:hypothetical protein
MEKDRTVAVVKNAPGRAEHFCIHPERKQEWFEADAPLTPFLNESRNGVIAFPRLVNGPVG